MLNVIRDIAATNAQYFYWMAGIIGAFYTARWARAQYRDHRDRDITAAAVHAQERGERAEEPSQREARTDAGRIGRKAKARADELEFALRAIRIQFRKNRRWISGLKVLFTRYDIEEVEEAAERGSANAAFILSLECTYNFRGEEHEDMPRSLRYLSMASKLGDAESIAQCASDYENFGMSLSEARGALLSLSERDEPSALINLSHCYNFGHLGFEKSLAKAVEYLERAVNGGSTSAKYELAVILGNVDDGEYVKRARNLLRDAFHESYISAEITKAVDDSLRGENLPKDIAAMLGASPELLSDTAIRKLREVINDPDAMDHHRRQAGYWIEWSEAARLRDQSASQD